LRPSQGSGAKSGKDSNEGAAVHVSGRAARTCARDR
jgi:hypothetical protein